MTRLQTRRILGGRSRNGSTNVLIVQRGVCSYEDHREEHARLPGMKPASKISTSVSDIQLQKVVPDIVTLMLDHQQQDRPCGRKQEVG